MSFKKILLSVSVLCFLISSFCASGDGLKVSVPSPDEDSDYAGEATVSYSDSENTWKELINQVNNYLWIILGVVAMGVVAYGGYILVSSEGDKEQLKKANKLVMFGMLGVLVAVSSYLIVNLVTGMF